MSTITRRKRSPIWTIPIEQLRSITASASTLSEVLRYFNLSAEGYNHGILKTRLKQEQIDISHIRLGRNHNKGRIFSKTKALTKEEALSQVFTEHSKWSRNAVKAYLRRYDLIPYQCKCGNKGEWEGTKLSLQLDHIDGRENHNLTNLRWLCPNCHSQTSNFSGKANKSKPPKPSELDPINYRKRPNLKVRKYTRPSKEELSKRVWEKPMTTLAKEYNVGSSNTIKKWCLSMDIKFPSTGYWRRRELGYKHEDALNPPPKPLRGPRPKTRFNNEQIDEIRRRSAQGESQRSIAKDFGSRNAVQAVLNNPHYGCRFGTNPSIVA